MMTPTITLNPAAEKFMKRMIRFSSHPAGGFRLTVSPGGCSGLASEFTVEEAPRAGDADLSVGGVRIFLPAESRLLLDGATIDFADTPTASGLTFQVPNQGACGCSSSSDATAPAQAAVAIGSIRRVARG